MRTNTPIHDSENQCVFCFHGIHGVIVNMNLTVHIVTSFFTRSLVFLFEILFLILKIPDIVEKGFLS